jgi:DNA-directed RNA polymerase specialized sigma24 family protein
MTDDEILQGMMDGDREAFDAFYAETKETVEKVCAYFLGDDQAMVGAAVGAYTRAIHQISQKHKPDMPPKAWMSVLAVQECFPHMLQYRQDYDRQSAQMEQMANQVPVLQEITSDSRERLSFMVRGEVEDMPDPHKEFLNMSELQGLSFLEIAKRLGQSWSNVVTKLFLARQILSKRVKEQLGI